MKRKQFDINSVFGNTDSKYKKSKIKSYNNKITSNFHGKAPKEGQSGHSTAKAVKAVNMFDFERKTVKAVK